jgi:hypothetical protein
LLSSFFDLISNFKIIFSFISGEVTDQLKQNISMLLSSLIQMTEETRIQGMELIQYFVSIKSKENVYFVEVCLKELEEKIKNEKLKIEFQTFLKEI